MKYNLEFLSLSKRELIDVSNALWEESVNEYTREDEDFDGTNDRKIFDKYKDKMKYRKIHCKIVAELCEKMFNINKEFFLKEKEYDYWFNILYIAALTHDIKKFTEEHSSAGAEWIKIKLTKSPKYFDSETCDCIYHIIKYHKSKECDNLEIEKENTIIKILIVFIRLADKLSKLVEKGKFESIYGDEADKKAIEIKENSEKIIYDISMMKGKQYILENLISEIMNDFKIEYCDKNMLSLI